MFAQADVLLPLTLDGDGVRVVRLASPQRCQQSPLADDGVDENCQREEQEGPTREPRATRVPACWQARGACVSFDRGHALKTVHQLIEAYKSEVAGIQGFSRSRSVIILTTAPSADLAHQLSQLLVERHLAACVNVSGPMTSVYRWQDGVQRDTEYQLVVKTAQARIDDVRDAIRQLHPYELPEFLVLEISGGDEAYLTWLLDATRPHG